MPRDTLLAHRINTLLLNANAAFPSQVKDAKDMVKEWRNAQRCRLVVHRRSDNPVVPFGSVSDGCDDESVE